MSEWESMPSYWDFFQDTSAFLKDNRVIQVDEAQDDAQFVLLTSHCIYTIIGAVLWTKARNFINRRFSKPLGDAFKLTERRQYELNTNLWALIYNAVAIPLLFLTVYYNHELFQRPSTVWKECCGNSPVPWDIQVNYLIWSSYEIHLMYALYFVEEWANDTLLYTVHHGVTLALLILSYGLGYQRVGLLVLVLLETTNIPLKAMKVLSAFRFQNDRELTIVTRMCSFLLFAFASSWFVFRLYWYPLKAIYAAGNIPKELQSPQQMTYQFACVVMLLFLLGLNIFWFLLILKLVWKVATGKQQKVRK